MLFFFGQKLYSPGMVPLVMYCLLDVANAQKFACGETLKSHIVGMQL